MSSFDDIFDAPQKQEPSRQPDATFDKEAWAPNKPPHRPDAYDKIDRTAESVAADGTAFQTYLDVQSRFERYSTGNALLIMAKNPHATKLGDVDYWKGQGGFVTRNQFDNPIMILEPGNEYTREDGSIGVSYNPKRVYDISQTTVRTKAQPQVNRDERVLIKALIHNAPAAVRATENMEQTGKGALLDPQQNIIFVRKGMDGADIFRSVAVELAHAEYAKGNPAYDRSANAFRAYCVSYMLCRKNGIDTKGYDFSRLPDTFAGMEAQDIRGELSAIRDTVADVSARMARVLEQGQLPRQQGHER